MARPYLGSKLKPYLKLSTSFQPLPQHSSPLPPVSPTAQNRVCVCGPFLNDVMKCQRKEARKEKKESPHTQKTVGWQTTPSTRQTQTQTHRVALLQASTVLRNPLRARFTHKHSRVATTRDTLNQNPRISAEQDAAGHLGAARDPSDLFSRTTLEHPQVLAPRKKCGRHSDIG